MCDVQSILSGASVGARGNLRNVRSEANAKNHNSKSRKPEPPSRFTFHVSPSLVPSLLDWFAAHARDLPWRRTGDPYAIWVSEIMLQQTQVKTVIPYFECWMRELPDVKSLANASTERIHKLWEGLGYYTRVRNMQKAAQVIMENHGGAFPRRFEDVLALPGIGRYTAGAICSIAFNQPAPILDGNVTRVLARVFGIRANVRERVTNELLWNIAEHLVTAASELSGLRPRRRVSPHDRHALRHQTAVRHLANVSSGNCPIHDSPFTIPPLTSCSALNQSLMELGATLCTPRVPACSACPISRNCVARRDRLTEEIPNPGERAKATPRRFAAFVVQENGRVLVRQRGGGVVNAQLWEFPNVEVALAASVPGLRRVACNELGCEVESLHQTRTIRHTITRYRIALEVYRAELNGDRSQVTGGEWRRIADLNKLAFTSAHRRIADSLMGHPPKPPA